MQFKNTKIVATIGPATESKEMLEKLMLAGVNVFRLNFSHGDFAEHQKRVDNIKSVMMKTGKIVAILQDLAGPKIRIGDFYADKIFLKENDTFTLTDQKIVGDEKKVYINYPNLSKEVKVGGFILLDDGKKKLEIIEIKNNEIICKVIVGGETKGRRGVNIPNANLKISSITEKDRENFKFAVKNKLDFIALSFVRSPEDVRVLRKMITDSKVNINIIAKIETPEAVENIDEIITLSDGIMVARGDLAIEVPAETVPMIQKMIIRKCNNACKPVITATQMLESMIKSPTPTRAEVSDVANAILDGTDAVMLSEETTLGLYPIEAVSIMAKVAYQLQDEFQDRHEIVGDFEEINVRDSIASAAVEVADKLEAKLIFSLTERGSSARMISRFRPTQKILVLSPNMATCQKLALSYGCHCIKIDRFEKLKDAFDFVRVYCIKNKLAKKGDKVVVVAGAPFNKKHVETNTLLVETI